MSALGFDLGKLLAPVGEDTFFRDYWEKQPLLLERDAPAHYAGLLSSADLESIIAFTRPKFLDPTVFATGPRRRQTVAQGWLAERPGNESVRFPGISELREVYAGGKTILLMTMQQRWPPIAELCRNLEGVFHCPVHANSYLTPRGAQGFDAHFDPHEVFVLQLEGHKHWRLYGAGRRFPLVDEHFDGPREQLGTPREVRLAPGDLLYIPRGFVHEAFTAEEASLHLTVGVNVYRWADLLQKALLAAARQDERLRASLPPGILGGGELLAAVTEHFRELLASLADGVRADEAVRALGDQFFGSMQPLPGGPFTAPAEKEALDLDTVMEKRPGTVCRVVHEGNWVQIEFPGGRVGGPLKIASALRFVADTQRFAVRALPDDLGADAKLVLVRRLLHERLLGVVRRAGK